MGVRRAVAAGWLLVFWGGCGGSEAHVPAFDSDRDASSDSTPARRPPRSSPDAGASDAGAGASHAGDAGGSMLPAQDAATATPTCGSVGCGLHGDCAEDPMTGKPACQCDKGYIVSASALDAQCVEDKTCIELRAVDCRDEYGSSGSAIGMTLSVAYCSGNPYTGLKRSDLVVEEQGEEAWETLLQSESLVSIVERKYVHHVYVVVDVSQSVRDSDVLDDVAKGIGRLLDALEALPDDFRVAVYLFDGKPYLHDPPFVRETGDFAAARAALPGLPDAPALDPRSTNLYGAIIRAIEKVERSQKLKDLVDDRGVLTTATVIVVSDGDDEAALRSFADVKARIDASVTRVVTVGLGDEANYPKLTELGRDGSFSAPTPDLATQAFDDIGAEFARVAESLYFIAYCSPKRAGQAVARVSIRGFDAAPVSCAFDANVFSSGCSADLFDPAKECSGRQCSSLIGCGDCPSGQCCVSGQCQAPTVDAMDEICGAEWMCDAPLTCATDAMAGNLTCQTAVALDGACNPELCNSGETFCQGMDADSSTCMAAKAIGEDCMGASECLTQHCDANPDYPAASSLICLAPIEMFQACGANGTCEPGSWCSSGLCRPQAWRGVVCTENAECLSGDCRMGATGVKRCAFNTRCYFPFSP